MPELEERQAKIEGILEQLEKRVGRLEVQLEALRTEFKTDIVRLETDIKTNFRWTVGMWITVMLGILALFFKIH